MGNGNSKQRPPYGPKRVYSTSFRRRIIHVGSRVKQVKVKNLLKPDQYLGKRGFERKYPLAVAIYPGERYKDPLLKQSICSECHTEHDTTQRSVSYWLSLCIV